MGAIVTVGAPAPAHDLIRLREPTAVTADGQHHRGSSRR
jgi:hypothetical protein